MSLDQLEDYLGEHTDGSAFTVYDYADAVGIDTHEASLDLQAHLVAQRTHDESPYLLYRLPGTRTRNAQWRIGHKARDARQIGIAFADDTRAKALRAFEPDLRRLAVINPRVAKQTASQISAVVNNAVAILEAAAAQGIDTE